jgi:hypothetical protein
MAVENAACLIAGHTLNVYVGLDMHFVARNRTGPLASYFSLIQAWPPRSSVTLQLRVEPVSCDSNRVSGAKIWILKIPDQRVVLEICPIWRNLKKTTRQRRADLLLTGRNVAGISECRTSPEETGLAGWGARTRTVECRT